MFWLVIALLILVVSFVFFMLGIRLLSEDKRLNRSFMPIKTRVFFALGNIGISLAVYTLYFWIEDNFLDWRGNEYETVFAVCIIIAAVFVGAAIFCLANGKIKISNSTAPAPTPDLNAAHCPQCGNVLPEGNRFCSVCGTPVESVAKPVSRVCGFCGEKVAQEEAYCPNCGHRLQD